ncbi:holo-[acyl-carrier protein] synthase [Candidatus Blochmanniella floridana]|uniref:Holo-[acyl-carrier-protein] synthase n=1 Tax=Blochmanniella floridana TaxID=203907 RepID=ACPS_BLOFL|nr:RecName: Full=Holo-[acyl-carrier-protein] synthase; Short=Holo-ACP synthase; AltName: Full=4'-phosphopantetheinyl transferase AcpS [Candidatus Blochmannia floridanus]CAD83224.1 holo-[acyl-carrier protein] synthase [Candidatus Blochmannia floridanus]
MIYGIGIDIVEINRIKKIVIRSGDKLAKRILRKSELKLYYSKEYPVRFLSKRFAAKEAVLKAFGTGMSQGITFSQFEIFNDDLGRPMLRFFSQAAVLAKKLDLVRTHVSVSDTGLYACSIVIFEC